MPAMSQSFVHLCNHSAFVALANLRYINALNNNNNNNHINVNVIGINYSIYK